MKPEIKAKWLAALRGDEYKQGQDELRTETGFCCLGVLCDIHAKETGSNGWGNAEYLGFTRAYMGQHTTLPSAVREWAGLACANPYFCDEENERRVFLSDLNDAGHSFKEIADLIEEHL